MFNQEDTETALMGVPRGVVLLNLSKEMTEAEVENILLGSVLADLPLREVAGFLRISKGSYEYRRACIGAFPGKGLANSAHFAPQASL